MSVKTNMQEILRNKITQAEAALEIAKGTIALQNYVVTSPRPGLENFVVVSGGNIFYDYQQGPVPAFTLEDANLLATGIFRDGQGEQVPLTVVTAQAFHARVLASLKDAIEQLERIPLAF